jgi:hypothetical protein
MEICSSVIPPPFTFIVYLVACTMASHLWTYCSRERGIEKIEWLYLQATNTGYSALLGHQTANTWLQAVKMATLFYGIQTLGCKWDGPCWGTRNGSQHSAGSHITGEGPASAESTWMQSSEITQVSLQTSVRTVSGIKRLCHSIMCYNIVTWHC